MASERLKKVAGPLKQPPAPLSGLRSRLGFPQPFLHFSNQFLLYFVNVIGNLFHYLQPDES